MKKTAIGIAYHNMNKIFSNNTFIPIQVGAAKSNLDLGIQRDDSGLNISELNCYCSELTATYWMWKNLKGYDYYGLTHYRRFFTFKKPSVFFHIKNLILFFLSKLAAIFIIDARFSTTNAPFKRIRPQLLDDYLNQFSIKINNYLNQTKTIDCICLKPIRSSARSNRKSFSMAVGMFQLQQIESIIERNHQDFVAPMKKSLKSNAYIPFNMVIMKNEEFDKYCQFIFSVLSEYHNWILNDLKPDGINNACLRSSGYIGEILTDIYIRKINAEGKMIKKFYVVELDAPGSGKSTRQISLIQRIKNVLEGGY